MGVDKVVSSTGSLLSIDSQVKHAEVVEVLISKSTDVK